MMALNDLWTSIPYSCELQRHPKLTLMVFPRKSSHAREVIWIIRYFIGFATRYPVLVCSSSKSAVITLGRRETGQPFCILAVRAPHFPRWCVSQPFKDFLHSLVQLRAEVPIYRSIFQVYMR